MELSSLTALCPLDGRYVQKLTPLRARFSEFGLMHLRVLVEVRWFMAFAEDTHIKEVPELDKDTRDYLENIAAKFSLEDAKHIKKIEQTTNHDVKAIEYFLQEKFKAHPVLKNYLAFIHFACTSEDINNLAYSLMIQRSLTDVIFPAMKALIEKLEEMGHEYADLAMLSRTHGQAATPTTLGKEIINVVQRLRRQLHSLQNVELFGKINGAVGNFNAHVAAYPKIDWLNFSKKFVENLGLCWNSHTTQIEPHDCIAEVMQALLRFNTIVIDLNRDIWSYISLGYFSQQKVANEVGSSTMPHKINPIDFENSEGNLGVANALADFFALKLPISRWQRDLTDSTVLRNIGLSFGYSYLSYQATLKGLNKLQANAKLITDDLAQHWEVLAEAVQTVMRRYGIADAYEQLKEFTRGEKIDQALLLKFINNLNIDGNVKADLRKLTPNNYIGLAKQLANKESF